MGAQIGAEIDIPVDAEVHCTDGLCGRSTYIILNPVIDRVTHVVVAQAGLPPVDRLVPIEMLKESAPHQIFLNCSKAKLAEMEHFTETEFVSSDDEEASPLLLWPYAVPESAMVPLEHERIPLGELAVHRGARVMATDGDVGRVDEFLVEPGECQVTHLVMRKGHLWGVRDIAIPISAIDRIEEDTVYLELDKAAVEALSTIPMRRPQTTCCSKECVK